MGGRGAKMNVNNYLGWSHERRIGEYDAIHVDGNMKFLMQKDGGRTAAPVFSNTEGRIYVTLNPQGKIVGITQYGSNHVQRFSINEPHVNEPNSVVHMHMGPNRTKINWNDMPKKYQDLYLSVKQKYKDYDILNKVKGYNAKYGR